MARRRWDVYRIVGVHEDWHQRLVAWLARCGGCAVASHRSAAALHRLDGFPEGPIDVLVPVASKTRVTGVRRTLSLDAADRCLVGGIPATSPVRTLIDLGAVADEKALVRALDAAERDRKVQRHILQRRLGEVGNLRGASALVDVIAVHGLPAPICQYAVTRCDGRTAYLDFAYPDRSLAIEVDGNGTHATPAERRADNERSNQLPGWRFLRFTYEDVTERGVAVAGTVALHLTS
jgi:hypothetical protein